MTSSGLWKMLHLSIFILTTDNTIGYVMSDTWCQMIWHLLLMHDSIPTQCCEILTQAVSPYPQWGYWPCIVGNWHCGRDCMNWRPGCWTGPHPICWTTGICQCPYWGMDLWLWCTHWNGARIPFGHLTDSKKANINIAPLRPTITQTTAIIPIIIMTTATSIWWYPTQNSLSKSYKNICGKMGIQVYFKWGNVIRGLLVALRGKAIIIQKKGVIYRYKCDE